jgi:ribonuclease HI
MEWLERWRKKHINEKELRAILLALRVFKGDLKRRRIGVKVDNQVALAYINRMIKRIPLLARIVRKIVEEMEEIGLSVTVVYIPSEENKKADKISKTKDYHN